MIKQHLNYLNCRPLKKYSIFPHPWFHAPKSLGEQWGGEKHWTKHKVVRRILCFPLHRQFSSCQSLPCKCFISFNMSFFLNEGQFPFNFSHVHFSSGNGCKFLRSCFGFCLSLCVSDVQCGESTDFRLLNSPWIPESNQFAHREIHCIQHRIQFSLMVSSLEFLHPCSWINELFLFFPLLLFLCGFHTKIILASRDELRHRLCHSLEILNEIGIILHLKFWKNCLIKPRCPDSFFVGVF